MSLSLIEALKFKADELERTRVAGPSVVMLLRDAAEALCRLLPEDSQRFWAASMTFLEPEKD